MLQDLKEKRGLGGKVKSFGASILRTGPAFPVCFIEKILPSICTTFQDQQCNLWDPVQNNNVGPLVQKLLRILMTTVVSIQVKYLWGMALLLF